MGLGLRRLKERPDGDIMVFGSAELVDSLLELDLVDELRILLFPVVLGSGKRLFRDERGISHLRLVGARAFDSGVVLLTYQPALEGPSSEYAQSMVFRLRDREKFLLKKIEKALQRIEEGTFGICERCEEPISPKRLEARPVTTLCIRCKEEQEKKEKSYG